MRTLIDPPPPNTHPDHQEINLLIADVTALTGVPAAQLRSWETAGLLHPRRSPSATRLYGIEDVARVRLIKRSLVNPGRRGSLRRLAAQLSSGDVQPAPEDYAGLVSGVDTPAPLSDSMYWQAVLSAMDVLVVVCDTGGRVTSMNPALQALLARADDEPHASHGTTARMRPARVPGGDVLPAALEALPLRWAAHTGTQHGDVQVVLRGPEGSAQNTLWTVRPLRDGRGTLYGAVGVGRAVPSDAGVAPEDWLAIAAHDLRSPVTNILGRLELARRIVARLPTDLLPANWRRDMADLARQLASAEVSTISLIRTMDTLLDASAAASGALISHLEPGGVAIDLVARQAAEHAQQQTTRHAITVDVPATPLLVIGDQVRLRQVLDNLLANALKYAPDGGPVTVDVEVLDTRSRAVGAPPWLPQVSTGPTPLWVLLRVEDAGLGIPVEAVPSVFDRFWRAAGPTKALPGTGLGLYTCRAIVTAHGGHIWVERSAVAAEGAAGDKGWHGTVMALLLPLATPPAPGDAHGSSTTDRPGTATGGDERDDTDA